MVWIMLSILETILFQFIRIGFCFIQSIIWRLNGVHAAREHKSREKCAQLLDIVWKCKFEVIFDPSPSEFITTHKAFVHPEYVLQNHVTLYHVTPMDAIFVESDPDVDVTHSSTHFFMYVAQHTHAKRLVRMPIKSLVKLADQLPDENAKFVFLNNTARCGSTLFCQMFEQTGHSVGFSEPMFFNDLLRQRKKLSEVDFKQRISACVRVLCHHHKEKIQAYIIKPQAQITILIPVLAELFPQSKQLFMYRDGVKVTKSFQEHVQRFKTGRLAFAITKYVTKKPFWEFMESNGIKSTPMIRDNINLGTVGLCLWGHCCQKYIEFRNEGIDIGAVRHEDILSSPMESLRAILSYCGLPGDWAHSAVKAMEKDSMQRLKENKVVQPFNIDMKVTDMFCEFFALPGPACVLPGTITHQK